MTTTTQEVLCGSCRVPVKGPSKPQDHDMITCPSCGRSDNFKNVMKSVAASAKEAMGSHFQEAVRKAARGSKSLKFTAKPIPRGSHPFVVDLKL